MSNGTGDKFKGKSKEAMGKLTGDTELEAEGKAQATKGEVKEKADEAGDAARGTARGLTGDDA